MFIVQHKTVILKVLLSIMRRKVVHGKVQGQRQKDRKVVGILATLLHSLTKIIEQCFRETRRYNTKSLTPIDIKDHTWARSRM